MNILAVAKASAPVEIPKAPDSPRRLIERKTLTTKTFKGIPNRFMITDLCESGTYLLRSVPIEGKYIPTHASNAKNPATNAARGMAGDDAARAEIPIAIVATVSMAEVDFSVETDIFTSWPNKVDPNRQHAMKHEKIVPYGVVAPSPNALLIAPLSAGGH